MAGSQACYPSTSEGQVGCSNPGSRVLECSRSQARREVCTSASCASASVPGRDPRSPEGAIFAQVPSTNAASGRGIRNPRLQECVRWPVVRFGQRDPKQQPRRLLCTKGRRQLRTFAHAEQEASLVYRGTSCADPGGSGSVQESQECRERQQEEPRDRGSPSSRIAEGQGRGDRQHRSWNRES